ncbi:uncharacterized protein F4812DRAFT_464478 [Daldinia caldariorum]|uniref:uncharacterized protein n=1 Tax=Daldinia caldariorum TaxID=326644 RepID=UPI002008B331|nr:uncharacterized protein F4812DRAFT_464478 [Daldinia caldariorum]KAI1472374.1 hypothetical protein F4812DRAFT_464478 [Daldinia caldariorum]
MRLNIFVLSAFATLLHASAIPRDVSSANASITEWAGPLYDCRGSIMCSTLHVKACDVAVNTQIIRDDELNYGSASSRRPHLGACHGLGADFGCAILVEGNPKCVRSGNDLWWDYQEIRKNGCHHCGHKYWGKGCKTTIDYEPECRRIW